MKKVVASLTAFSILSLLAIELPAHSASQNTAIDQMDTSGMVAKNHGKKKMHRGKMKRKMMRRG
jgi:hypothetical protein